MAPKVVAFAMNKGGTGKTTTCLAVGQAMARRGVRVLTIDLDAQGNLSATMGADRSAPGSYELMTGDAAVRDCVQSTAVGDVVPSSPRLASVETDVPRKGREHRLREALQSRLPYDAVLLDTPPGTGLPLIDALTAADGAVLVGAEDAYTLQGLEVMAATIGDVREYTNPGIAVPAIVVTRHNPRIKVRAAMLSTIRTRARQFDGCQVCTVRECSAVSEAYVLGRDLYDYAPRSNAAKDYEEAAAVVTDAVGIRAGRKGRRRPA